MDLYHEFCIALRSYAQFLCLFFSVVYFSHRRSAQIKSISTGDLFSNTGGTATWMGQVIGLLVEIDKSLIIIPDASSHVRFSRGKLWVKAIIFHFTNCVPYTLFNKG